MLRPLALSLMLALPATAQQVPHPDGTWAPPPAEAVPPLPPEAPQSPDTAEGLDMIERGAGTVLDNLMRKIEPHMQGIANAFGETTATIGPVLDDLAAQVDDIANYEKPERLPNGDILIRRRADAPPPPAGNALRDLTRPAPDQPQRRSPNPPMVVPQGPQVDL